MRWAPYVAAAVEFAQWAFLSPAERAAAIRADNDRRMCIEAEISRTSSFTSIVAGRPLERYDEESVAAAAAAVAAAGASGVGVGIFGGGGRVVEGGGGAGIHDGGVVRVTGAAGCRSPLRELRRPPAIVVPKSPMAAAVVRRVNRRGRDDEDEWEAKDFKSTTKTKDGNENAGAGGAGADGEVASVAGEAAEEAAATMSVEEALARTSLWLDGVKGELAPGGGDSPHDAAGEAAHDILRASLQAGEGGGGVAAIERARLVEEAFSKTETWLVRSSYGGGEGVGGTLNFVDAPDF
jgi:hypothetical protein